MRFYKINTTRKGTTRESRHRQIELTQARCSKTHSTVMQWRTLTIIVGGAKSYYMAVEGANLKYFVFYMVKKGK
jgi:hypothetical protein